MLDPDWEKIYFHQYVEVNGGMSKVALKIDPSLVLQGMHQEVDLEILGPHYFNTFKNNKGIQEICFQDEQFSLAC